MCHADTWRTTYAQCRGIRRIHLRLNTTLCKQAYNSHIKLICAWLTASRKKSCLINYILFFITYYPVHIPERDDE